MRGPELVCGTASSDHQAVTIQSRALVCNSVDVAMNSQNVKLERSACQAAAAFLEHLESLPGCLTPAAVR